MRQSHQSIVKTAFLSLLVGACVSAVSPAPISAPRPSTASSALPTGAIGTPGPTVVPSPSRAIVAAAWLATGQMATPHAFHTATLLRDGRVLVVGGLIQDMIDGRVLATADLYDPTSGSWAATGGMKHARWGHTATLLTDGRVLVAGGYVDSGGKPLASAELYDPSSGRWTTTGSMTTGRGGQTATLLPDGTVLVVGGGAENTELEGSPRSATAELYDPASGSWTATRNMTDARVGHRATLLPDGKVLVVGGSGHFRETELYDPSSGRWTSTGSTSTPQGGGHSATLLLDGRVLVAGGNPGSEWDPLATAELYDPGHGRWTVTGGMATPRAGHTATLLSDGTVLVVGSSGVREEPIAAETYDPSSGRWAATASPARPHDGYTATLLTNGMVLLVGDFDYESRAAAELYVPAG